MLGLRARVVISLLVFAAVGICYVLLLFYTGPVDNKLTVDFQQHPFAFSAGLMMPSAVVAIIAFIALSLIAWGFRRWHVEPAAMDRVQLYSPNQVLCGSLFGGPLAATVMLNRNYTKLKKFSSAKATLIIGLLSSLAFFSILCIIVYNKIHLASSVGTAIGVGYSVLAKSIVTQYQISKQAISNSDRYTFRSNWRVVGVASLYLAATLIILFLGTFVLILSGFHLPK